jgi:hypothetical protein
MSMNSRPLVALALMALIGLISAGCGSDASSETGTATSATSAGTASSAREKGLKFAECMRDNGVAEFPDPDASGELTIDGVVNGSSLDPNSAVFRNAISACKDLEPAGFTGHKRSDQEQEGALKFAQCVRENGVKDFPDPVKGAPLVDTNRIPSSATSGGMTILNAAMHTCSALAAKAGVSR